MCCRTRPYSSGCDSAWRLSSAVARWSARGGKTFERRQDFFGTRQTRRVGDVPAIDNFAALVDDDNAAAEDVLQSGRAREEQPVRLAKFAIEIAEQHQLGWQIELVAPGIVG